MVVQLSEEVQNVQFTFFLEIKGKLQSKKVKLK